MTSIQLLIFLVLFMIPDTGFSLYYSSDRLGSNSTFDCLYAYILDYTTDQNALFTINSNLIPYCRRLDQNDEQQQQLSVTSYTHVENNITFADMYQRDVTSAQLLNWLAPIDVVERYEKHGRNSNEIFHNCSLPWFGSTCQYRLENSIPSSFSNVVRFILKQRSNKPVATDSNIRTCYPFLNGCYREDEQTCQILEVNACSDNEYRCHFGGQCIPSAFVRDGKIGTDCLDGSDEMDIYYEFPFAEDRCVASPTFRCEEYKSRRPFNFSCGDGDIYEHMIPHLKYSCFNGLDLILRCSTIGADQVCSHSSLFHCPRSLKCISKHRLNDGENDCYFAEDEMYPACSLNDSWRFTCPSERNKCLSIIAIENEKQYCRNGEDEWNDYQREILKGNIPFGLFCDGINDLKWANMSNDTDETHCEWWPCNNEYFQCNNL
ncbi:unnamed protein product [Rotaria sp. Silwood2]|nr:unnamed protein product [Rotaria sp. Silwood2]CAF4519626.1 unnamed protein product [Rotaria sp. Silwood2]